MFTMRTKNISFLITQLSTITNILRDLETLKEVKINLGNISYSIRFSCASFIIKKFSRKNNYSYTPFIVYDTKEFIELLINTLFMSYDHDLQKTNKKIVRLIKPEALKYLKGLEVLT